MAELLCRSGDPEWLELRRSGVTATDITVIAGLVTWDSPWALFWRKRGVLPPVEQTDRMRLGLWLEGHIARQFLGESIWEAGQSGLYASSDRPWQVATPDHVLTHGAGLMDEPIGVLECKSWSTTDGWGPDGSGEVPAHIRAQVLWQMDTLAVPRGHVAVVFLPSGEFRSYTIEHLDEKTHDELGHHACAVCTDQDRYRALGLEFYRRLIGELPPPDVDGHAATTAGLKTRYASPGASLRAELPPALMEAWEEARDELAAARAGLREYEAAARAAENQLRAALADAVVGTVDGRPVIERKFIKRAGYNVAPSELDQLKPIKGES